MLKNKTQEFKQRYSSSLSSKQSIRDKTPQNAKSKFAMTGFTDLTTQNSVKLKNSRKMAKVQSTAFLRNRKKLECTTESWKKDTNKIAENQTSLCRYFDKAKIKIENTTKKPENEPKQFDIFSKQPVNISFSPLISNKNSITVKQLPDIEAFFQSLTPRSLFFCCKCFRYVFAIQRNLHHPKCQNQLNLMEIGVKDKQKLGWQKLEVIMELSSYTKHKFQTISNLHDKIKNKNPLRQLDEIIISQNVNYLGFEEILEAFLYTYEMLIKEEAFQQKSGIFNFKKIFSCSQPKFQRSNLYQRKFFM